MKRLGRRSAFFCMKNASVTIVWEMMEREND